MTGVERSSVGAMLEQARRALRRVGPEAAAALVAAGAVLVDIRPVDYRRDEGVIPGAWILERNVLEWRLDPASPDRLPAVGEDIYDRPVIVVCNEGYASSLAAASLRQLGLAQATDLDGGFRAWAAAGLPVAPGPGAPSDARADQTG
ncbi:hypothetical protein K6U06_13740 [Acidiferrimicrobium sp. IK]|nr:rhodanese-like domain-containing protein [Acidiferrimicrobium sp. IK]MCU4185430.1 hypothetical protein [Acidiferrimicrobium sp. IK]